MPALIQRIPPGLLSFLGLKSTGQNPNVLADTVVPTLNLEHLYLAQDLRVSSATQNVANAGQSISLAVPNGEAWRVLGIGYSADTLTAPATLKVALKIAPGGAVACPVYSSWPPHTVSAASDIVQDGIFVPQPFVAPSGTGFTAFLEQSLGVGTTNLAVIVLFQRLQT